MTPFYYHKKAGNQVVRQLFDIIISEKKHFVCFHSPDQRENFRVMALALQAAAPFVGEIATCAHKRSTAKALYAGAVMAGTEHDTLAMHALLENTKRPYLTKITRKYLLNVIAKINNIEPTAYNAHWLFSLAPRINAAIRNDINSRIANIPLAKDSFSQMIALYYSEYRELHCLVDYADLIRADYFVSEHIKFLALLDIERFLIPHIMRRFPGARVLMAAETAYPGAENIQLAPWWDY